MNFLFVTSSALSRYMTRRPNHFARLLAREHRVTAVASVPLLSPTERSGPWRSVGVRRLPFSRVGRVAAWNEARLERALTRVDADVVLCYDPRRWRAALRAKRSGSALLIYDCTDDAAAFERDDAKRALVEQCVVETARRADVVLAVSETLASAMRAHNRRVHLLRNAADGALLSVGRSRVPRPVRVVGYAGAVSRWFDFALYADTARRLPDVEFRIAGRANDRRLGALRALDNVRYLGEVPYERLGKTLADFDVGVVPFVQDRLTRAVNPIKVYEYLAAGLPVVSTPMPEAAAFGSLCAVAPDAASFAEEIARVREGEGVPPVAERVAFAERNTWERRVAKLLEIVAEAR